MSQRNPWQQVGDILAGNAAGIQGNSEQFRQNILMRDEMERQQAEAQRAEKLRADQMRRSTMFRDAEAVQGFIKQGRWDLAVKLGENRLAASVNFPGVDFGGTQRMVAMSRAAAGGDANAQRELSKIIDDNVEIGYATGELQGADPMAAAKLEETRAKTEKTRAETSALSRELEGGGAPGVKVQSSEILPDGTVVQVMSNGVTSVVDRNGVPLEGGARFEAIRDAREFGAETQRQRATGRTLGTDIPRTSIQIGKDAFEKLAPISKNIKNLDRVVSMIDRGAGTGAIERLLPSVKSASIELDNMRNLLGLDILGEVTFGSLSKGELDLALDTALPTALDGPELKRWAETKRAAQQKTLKEMRKVAKFFSMGGSITEFLELQDRQNPPAQEPQGFKIIGVQ